MTCGGFRSVEFQIDVWGCGHVSEYTSAQVPARDEVEFGLDPGYGNHAKNPNCDLMLRSSCSGRDVAPKRSSMVDNSVPA
jgi:hypothetical protein